jgi:hypothetical protein
MKTFIFHDSFFKEQWIRLTIFFQYRYYLHFIFIHQFNENGMNEPTSTFFFRDFDSK